MMAIIDSYGSWCLKIAIIDSYYSGESAEKLIVNLIGSHVKEHRAEICGTKL